VDRIFESIGIADEKTSFQLKVSYFEVYCERVRDLLNPSQDNLKLRETRTEGFVVQDVTETFCTDAHSVLTLVELGKANRVSAPTLMNAESSRSHSILSLTLSQTNEATGRSLRGRLFIIDLAGSEKVGSVPHYCVHV
jgi:kinesin family protein 5